MKILLLAPHPFYQERGTPIAVDMLAKALTERGDIVDILAFNEGQDRSYPGMTIYRVDSLIKVTEVKPGFSLKKLFLDFFLFFKFIKLMFKKHYDVVHAVEESAFMAMIVCPLFRVKYICDMDSSMASQLIEKFGALKIIMPLLRFLESLPIRNAQLVIAVCDSLAATARQYRKNGVFILKDVSLVKSSSGKADNSASEDLRAHLKIKGFMAMYIGNLESYQGIDLLMDAANELIAERTDTHIVIIGGAEQDIKKYRAEVLRRGLGANVHVIGTRPVSEIGNYMKQADILLSPRIKGENTPMKIYSYLDSGVPVIATDLPTHTQVMSTDISYLVKPEPTALAKGIVDLIENSELGKELSGQAREYIKKEHSYAVFKKTLYNIYDKLN